MNRTLAATLALVALLALAGCSGVVPGENNDTIPTTQPSDTSTPAAETPTAYPETTTELPDGPMEPPERPAELNRTSAASYVQTFEYRYAYNVLWYDDSSDVNVECDVESVEPDQEGYRVTVGCYGYSNTGGESNGTATATEVHADWGDRSFTYYVDEDTTLRLDTTQTASPE